MVDGEGDELKRIREELSRLSERIERLEVDNASVHEILKREKVIHQDIARAPADKDQGGSFDKAGDKSGAVSSSIEQSGQGADKRAAADIEPQTTSDGERGNAAGSESAGDSGKGADTSTAGAGRGAGTAAGAGSHPGSTKPDAQDSNANETGGGWFKPGGPAPAYAGAVGSDSSLEAKIGQYWLNRIGIGSVVLGMVFLILYAFQSFGPMAKIATGIFCSLAMVVAGEVFGRKDKSDWFWRGFIGGGWALMYFTTFAAYHVEYVRVIPSAHVDFLFLLLVAAGAVSHALKYESVVVTSMALSLALLSICFAPAGFFSALSGLLILGALCWIVMKMGWHGMLTYGVTAYYLASLSRFVPALVSQTGLVSSSVLPTIAAPSEMLNTVLWCLSWAIVVWTVMKLPDQVGSKRTNLIVTSLINAFMFCIGIRILLNEASILSYDGVYAGFGLAYFLLARQCHQTSRSGLMNTLCLIGVSMLTLFFGSRLTGQAEQIVYLIEIPLLVAVGIIARISALRWFAAFMAIVSAIWATIELSAGFHSFDLSSWHFHSALLTMAAFAVCCWLYRVKAKTVENLSPTLGFYFYFIAAWLLSLTTVQLYWTGDLFFGSFILCCALPVVLGFPLKERPLRVLGCCALVLIGMPHWLAMFGFSEWNIRDGWFGAVVIGSLVYLYIRNRDKIEGGEQLCGHIYSCMCTFIVASLLGHQFDNYKITLSWAVEGMLLLFVGFTWKDKVLRVLGLVMFGLVVIKLLFVDMAQADTVYRILSFIGAGLMLIVASFAYMKLTSQIDEKAKSSETKPA